MDSWLVPVLIGDSRPGRIDVHVVGICCPWGRERGQGEQALSSTAFFVALHGVGSRKQTESSQVLILGEGETFLGYSFYLVAYGCVTSGRFLQPLKNGVQFLLFQLAVSFLSFFLFFFKKTLYINHLVLKKKKKKQQASTKCFKILFWICFFFLRLPTHDKGRLTEETGRDLLILLRWVEL